MLEASRKASVASSGCRNEDCACRHLKSFHLAASYAVRRKVDRRFKVTLDIPSRSPSFPLKRQKGQGAIDLYVCNVNSSVCIPVTLSLSVCLSLSPSLSLSLAVSLTVCLIYVSPGGYSWDAPPRQTRWRARHMSVYRLRWKTVSRYALDTNFCTPLPWAYMCPCPSLAFDLVTRRDLVHLEWSVGFVSTTVRMYMYLV